MLVCMQDGVFKTLFPLNIAGRASERSVINGRRRLTTRTHGSWIRLQTAETGFALCQYELVVVM